LSTADFQNTQAFANGTGWSRVALWVETGREQRVVTVVSEPLPLGPGLSSDADAAARTVWVLWENKLLTAGLGDLTPYKACAATVALEALATALIPHAFVCLPKDGADGNTPSWSSFPTRLQPVQHYTTVSMHANRCLWVSQDVHVAVRNLSSAVNWVSARAQLLFGRFVRLLLSTHPDTPYGVPAAVWCRLRTWLRRAYSMCNPASTLYGLTCAECRDRGANCDSGVDGDGDGDVDMDEGDVEGEGEDESAEMQVEAEVEAGMEVEAEVEVGDGEVRVRVRVWRRVTRVPHPSEVWPPSVHRLLQSWTMMCGRCWCVPETCCRLLMRVKWTPYASIWRACRASWMRLRAGRGMPLLGRACWGHRWRRA
jgi:hypothetical protein